MGDDFKPNLRRIAQALNHGQELRRAWVCARNLWVVALLLRIDRRGWRSVCATFCGYPQICREPEERVLNSLVIEVDGQGARMPVPLDAGGFLGVAELISILTFWLRSLYSPGVPKSLVDSFPAARHASPASISKKRVTRNDVAARAGVPPSTVSYVINSGPRPVSTSARERVLKAISELGYHPSDVARSLRTRRTLTIGLVIPDAANPFYGELARAVEEVSFQNGYTVILGHSSHLLERELRYAQVLRSKQVDGAIFHPSTSDLSPIHFLRQAGVQVVVLEHRVPGYPCIVADDKRGGYLATRHLLDLGHRRIGCIVRAGDPTTSAVRVDGYRAALLEAGIPSDERLIVASEFGYMAGEEAVQQLLRLRKLPTAVVAHNDIIAIGAMKALGEAGLRVPADISIVGFDDIALASYVRPPLTTVSNPKHQMGRVAAEVLLRLLSHEAVDSLEVSALPVHLVVRESTAPPP